MYTYTTMYKNYNHNYCKNVLSRFSSVQFSRSVGPVMFNSVTHTHTAAHQAPLSMDFSSNNICIGCHFLLHLQK